MKKALICLIVVAVLVTMAFTGVACKATTAETTAAATTAAATTAAATTAAATTAAAETTAAAKAKVIGYYMDAADDYYKAGFQVFEALGKEKGWEIISVVGQGTAPEQLSAVQNFITQKVDAIVVVQNSPQTTSECLKLALAANIPYFGLTQTSPNEPGLVAFSSFDWVADGKLAGVSAIAHNVKKVIVIEGKLGQGAAGGQTNGFFSAYKEAGKDIGDILNNVGVVGGGADLQAVFWGSGGWFADPAKKAMQDAITALGPNGFDGAYVENDEMMTGALQAMQEAGLDTSKYWLGASNGKEKSWDWVEKGITTMDVNQPPTLEADILFQQVSANFDGKEFKKGIFCPLKAFDKTNMDRNSMVPWILADYMAKRAANAFIWDINDPSFIANPDYK
jgi:ABC-type sugar transport system substrate-binding protein